MPETFIIVNESAARARQRWETARAALTAAGVRFDAHAAREPGDAQAQTRAALRTGYRTIAVVGGDGTLGAVAAGFMTGDEGNAPVAINPNAALALLPGGTGNDFARSFEHQRASLDVWLARLVKHCRGDARINTTRSVDLLHGTADDGARSFLCLNAVTLGIGAEVAARVASQSQLTRRLTGEVRFGLAAIGALARWRGRQVRIRVGGNEVLECATNLIAVVNSSYAGGGMMFSPAARIDDGLLDVVAACDVPRRMIVRELARIHRGGHLANPRVRLLRGACVTIEPVTATDKLFIEADGDVRGYTPLTLRVLPGALRVVY